MSSHESEEEAEVVVDDSVLIGHIYRLDGVGRFYIGSTTLTPEERLEEHVRRSHRQEQFAVHRYFGEVGWDKVRMTVIRTMTATLQDLRRAEGEVIEELINDPACLNQKRTGRYETPAERHARAYPIGRGLPIPCTCGVTIVQCQMEAHLQSEHHLRNTILTTVEPSTEEKIAEESEMCKCGERILHRVKAVHEKCARHLLKMRIKKCKPSDLRIPVPPILNPTPEGYDANVDWCQCPCGAITRYYQFSQHLPGLKHLQAMFDRGLIKESATPVPVDRSNTIECRCGETIRIKHAYAHEQTKTHKANLRKLQLLKPPASTDDPVSEVLEDVETDIVESDDEETEEVEEHPPEPAWKTAAKERIPCTECGALITVPNMPAHKLTAKHRDRIERQRLGLPEPVLKVFQRSKPVTCGCGSTFVTSGTRQHGLTQKHISWQAKQPATTQE